MKRLSAQDEKYLEAAEGWLGLGDHPSVIMAALVQPLMFIFTVPISINHSEEKNNDKAREKNDDCRILIPYLAEKIK